MIVLFLRLRKITAGPSTNPLPGPGSASVLHTMSFVVCLFVMTMYRLVDDVVVAICCYYPSVKLVSIDCVVRVGRLHCVDS